MSSQILRERARELVDALRANNYLLEQLRQPDGVLALYEQAQELLAQAVQIEDQNKTVTLVSQARVATEGAAKRVRTWPSRSVYRAIEALEGALGPPPGGATPGLPFAGETIQELQQMLSEAADGYERFLQEPSRKNTLDLLESAAAFLRTLDPVAEVLADIDRAISGSPIPDEYDVLTLIFEADLTIEGIATTVRATESMYAELAGLLAVSVADHPLLLRRVEVGRTFVEEIGLGVLINLMSALLTEAGKLITGRLRAGSLPANLPAQLDEMDRLLQFSQKMEAADMDASVPKAELEKSAALIAKSLTASIEGRFLVRVNDTEIAGAAEGSDRRLLGSRPRRMLTGGTPADPAEE